jgi:hypothetical protein
MLLALTYLSVRLCTNGVKVEGHKCLYPLNYSTL